MTLPQFLAGKVALITGGSKGIGKATAIFLASQGASVVINYSSDSSSADEVVKAIGTDRCIAIKGDAGKLEDIDAMVKQTVDKFGKIDILVPNAGVNPAKNLHTTTENDFDKCIAVNVKGPYFLVQKAVPYMPPGSRVILISTTLCVASTVSAEYLLYMTSKGAIEQMTRVMAKDLGSKQISVNAVAPGPTGTDLFVQGKSEETMKHIASLSPQNRLGKPEEIAETIAYLANSSWISGQVVRVNGAMA